MAIANDPLAFSTLFAGNPALGTMIDGAANLAAPKGPGQQTATLKANANATANQAGQAVGQAIGQIAGQGLQRPGSALGSFAVGLVQGLADGLSKSFAPSSPSPSDNCPRTDPSTGEPSQLAVDSSSGCITTAGGYKIQPTSQFEWTITGPDGSSSRIWGDPHVSTSGKTGGENFDFKQNSTFVLPDGTKINVKTTPWGNGNVTVTQALEIIQGNDRVEVNDIDKGKGKVGKLTHGPDAREKFDTTQTFVAGHNVADWYFNGAEVKGNINGEIDKFAIDWATSTNDIGKEAFLVGGFGGVRTNGAGKNVTFYSDDLQNFRHVAEQATQGAQGGENSKVNQALQQVLAILPALTSLLSVLAQLRSTNAYNPQPAPKPVEPQKPTTQPARPAPYDPKAHAQGLKDAFGAIGNMLIALGNILQLMSSMKTNPRPVQT